MHVGRVEGLSRPRTYRLQQNGVLRPLQHHVALTSHRRSTLVAKAAASPEQHVPVAIAGAGIAGLSAAVAFYKLGVSAVVLERASALRREGSAISLWSNAWRALDALGVSHKLRGDYNLLTRVELVSSKGKQLRSFTLKECGTKAAAAGGPNETRGMFRAHLLEQLADMLPDDVIRYNSCVTAVTTAQGKPQLQLPNGEVISCDVLVGADGANSLVAQHLGLPATNYAGYMAYRGVASFSDGLPLPQDTIRQMFGAGVRAGMYPINDKDAYWYICFNAQEGAPRPVDAADCVAEALAAVDGWSWGIQQAVNNTDPDSISRAAIRDRWTRGSFGQGCITLVGDAAHPMTPNLGQGGCTALEDAVILARQLAPLLSANSNGNNTRKGAVDTAAVAAALRHYETERSRRCLPITVRSYAFGAALQLPYAPVVAARDLFVQTLFQPTHFLDHTSYDCGTLSSA